METELERTFLAAALPSELGGINPQTVTDVYVPDSANHPILRIRQKGENYEITKKAPSKDDASEQIEQTIPLTKDEFSALVKTSSKIVSKQRYKVSIDGHPAEVDVFKDKLKGLILIDFEFDSIEAKAAFVSPACCLADVTREEFIAGGMLAGKSYKDIEKDLAKFKYEKILD